MAYIIAFILLAIFIAYKIYDNTGERLLRKVRAYKKYEIRHSRVCSGYYFEPDYVVRAKNPYMAAERYAKHISRTTSDKPIGVKSSSWLDGHFEVRGKRLNHYYRFVFSPFVED